jgi:hypothetical protein
LHTFVEVDPAVTAVTSDEAVDADAFVLSDDNI